jgi:hypothetical protein
MPWEFERPGMGMPQANGSNRKKRRIASWENRRFMFGQVCRIAGVTFSTDRRELAWLVLSSYTESPRKLPSGAAEVLRLRQHIGVKLSGLPSVCRAHLVCR